MHRRERAALATTGLLTALALALTGCSNPGNTNAGAAVPKGGASLPPSCKANKPTIGVALPNTVNPYYIAMRKSFLDNGAKAGLNVKVAIADDSDSTQLTQVESFIQQHVCAIALNGVNSGPAAADVAAANHAGIPVFSVNVIIDPAAMKRLHASVVQYVGPDQVAGGRIMGKQVLKDLGSKARIVAGIGGDPDQIPTNQRDQGFKQALSADPNASVETTVNTKVDPNISLQVITDMLQGNPNINVVFADTGPAAVGAIQAIKQLGKAGKVSLYAFCAASTKVDGHLYRACVAQEPAQYAQIVVQNIKKYLAGKNVPQNILVPVKLFTAGQTPPPGEVG